MRILFLTLLAFAICPIARGETAGSDLSVLEGPLLAIGNEAEPADVRSIAAFLFPAS